MIRVMHRGRLCPHKCCPARALSCYHAYAPNECPACREDALVPAVVLAPGVELDESVSRVAVIITCIGCGKRAAVPRTVAEDPRRPKDPAGHPLALCEKCRPDVAIIEEEEPRP